MRLIGTGIAGNAAAWALSQRYPVTVYDRELRAGGHSHTVTIDYDGTPMAVDTGFIVYNEVNYPDLTALFEHLGVETQESCMSFAVTADAGRFEWKGGGDTGAIRRKGLFAQRAQSVVAVLSVDAARHSDIQRRRASRIYAAGRLAGLSLGEYFKLRSFAPRLLTDYLAPMGAAIWSAPAARDAGFSGRELRRILQQSSPVAI